MPKMEKEKMPRYMILLGALACICRGILYLTGVDEKGLLIPWHLCEILVWLLTLAAAAGILVMLPQISGSNHCEEAFCRGKAHLAVGILAAAGIAVTTVTEFQPYGALIDWLSLLFGVLAVAGTAASGWCRSRGKRPNFLFHGALCVYLALRTVCRYRVWSADPQLMDYFFSLMAGLLMMLTAYHHAAFDAGMGNRKLLTAFSWGGIFCCLTALSSVTWESLLYLALLLWTLCNLPGKEKPHVSA